MRTRHITVALAFVALVATPHIVRAQNTGALANVSVGVASGDRTTGIAISGGVAYRFNRSIGFGIELTHLPSLESDSGLVRILGVPTSRPFVEDDDEDGYATIFTTNIRVEIPTTMRRIIPYVVGGGGMASVTESYPIYYALTASTVPPALLADVSSALSVPYPAIYPGPRVYQYTTTAMALNLGGGASVLITDRFAVDVDLRAFRLLGEDKRTMGRFGVGASYRF